MNMRRSAVRIFFCVMSVLMSAAVAAQTTTRISGNFLNFRFPQFVREIESRIDCHFFYNPDEIDSLQVNVRAEQLTLTELLEAALVNTSFRFTVDSFNNVFVYDKRFIIEPNLPSDFFSQKITESPIVEKETVNIAKAATGVGLKTSLENKLFEFGPKSTNMQGKAMLAGYVRDIKNGEPITGASVYIDTLRIGALTDQFGYFTLSLPNFVIKGLSFSTALLCETPLLANTPL